MILYVIRHGETDLNREKRLQGCLNIPLNEKGIELAKVTGEALKAVPFDMVYTSPLIRARLTAELTVGPSEKCFGRKIPFIEDPRLAEIDFGDFEGLGCGEENFALPGYTFKTFSRFYADPFHIDPFPNGEGVKEVIARTDDALQQIVNTPAYQDKIILVSTHGCAGRAMLNRYYEDKTDFWQGKVPYNCEVNILRTVNGRMQFVSKNQVYYDKSLCFDFYTPED
ncbi:MAG: histidine phosphatase family protein [Lachnospiraceae bacterium]|nr:histidine phosphatase family protein [Lachnospiraceae bacterium]